MSSMKKNLLGCLFTFILMATLLVFTYDSKAEQDNSYTWKIATLAPDGVGWAPIIKNLLHPEIKRLSDNKMVLEWFWGGIMGDEEDYIAKMKIDQLQGAGITGCGLAMACPEFTILGLPFLFSDYKELDYVKAKLRPSLDKLCEKHGYKLFLLADEDFAKIYSVKYKFRAIDDFTNSRFITWYGSMESDMLKNLGTSPIPVNVPEITASMRAGVCDSFIAPAIWVVGSQLYTILKYVNPVNLRYSPAGILVSMKAWNNLPVNLREKLLEIRKMEPDFSRQIRESNDKCLNAMLKYGLKEIKLTDDELRIIKKRCLPLWQEMAGKHYPKALLTEVLGYLDEYRAIASR